MCFYVEVRVSVSRPCGRGKHPGSRQARVIQIWSSQQLLIVVISTFAKEEFGKVE